MAGHNRWTQIKHQKGAADQKKGAQFSRLLAAVYIAARSDENPKFNPRLKAAIENARAHNVPKENILRAISRAHEGTSIHKTLILEAYGPGGVAIIIEAATDNKNRTIAEIRKILNDYHGRLAEPGSVRWAFNAPQGEEKEWIPKFTHHTEDDTTRITPPIIEALKGHPDVKNVLHR